MPAPLMTTGAEEKAAEKLCVKYDNPKQREKVSCRRKTESSAEKLRCSSDYARTDVPENSVLSDAWEKQNIIDIVDK